jgi:Raf kinase inhibitor-like YbhB/YbcL family protein
MSRLTFAIVLLATACAQSENGGGGATSPESKPMKNGMTLTSTRFGDGEAIPIEHTCEGSDSSPPLSWSDVPEGTQSLALIVDDPDAPDPAKPQRVWVHWVVFNIPPEVNSLPAGASSSLPGGAATGKNDWNEQDWGGPCPPIGRHRYFHKLYALDTRLELDAPTKAELVKAMEGHVLAQAELVGTYQKKKKTTSTP